VERFLCSPTTGPPSNHPEGPHSSKTTIPPHILQTSSSPSSTDCLRQWESTFALWKTCSDADAVYSQSTRSISCPMQTAASSVRFISTVALRREHAPLFHFRQAGHPAPPLQLRTGIAASSAGQLCDGNVVQSGRRGRHGPLQFGLPRVGHQHHERDSNRRHANRSSDLLCGDPAQHPLHRLPIGKDGRRGGQARKGKADCSRLQFCH